MAKGREMKSEWQRSRLRRPRATGIPKPYGERMGMPQHGPECPVDAATAARALVSLIAPNQQRTDAMYQKREQHTCRGLLRWASSWAMSVVMEFA
jgi:hypothetical protein